jgi:hypothetical protein
MQSKKYSIIESVANTLIGLVTSFIIQLIIYPLLDIPVSLIKKTMKDKNAIEWLILIGLFKATIEQKSMLIGTEKQRAKQLFNNWMRQGTNILSKFEANFTEEQLEELSLLVETSMNDLRKNIIVVD